VTEHRAERQVRKFLGQRLRALRAQKDLTQQQLGERAGLSGKFIGEVERAEKSISVDNLYALAVALEIPLGHLADVPAPRQRGPTSEDAHKIFALLSGPLRPEDARRAYEVLRALLGKVS
jgi:transcriptional regulator with XRE-family HTH domain